MAIEDDRDCAHLRFLSGSGDVRNALAGDVAASVRFRAYPLRKAATGVAARLGNQQGGPAPAGPPYQREELLLWTSGADCGTYGD